MKKLILSIILIFSALIVPAAGHCDYAIHLKNGGRFLTPRYWEQDQEIQFYIAGGVMGIEKNSVRKIEKLPDNSYRDDYVVRPSPPPPAAEKRPAEAEQNAEKTLSPSKHPAKIDLKAYQDKMATLKTDLNKTLTRIRKADKSNDLGAKDEATEDNRKISAEMLKLTEELKEKNNGKLPADWWEGVGREEPATP